MQGALPERLQLAVTMSARAVGNRRVLRLRVAAGHCQRRAANLAIRHHQETFFSRS